MKKYLLVLFVCAFSAIITVSAQSKLKIGHIDSQELLSAMPASDTAQRKLEKIAKEHELVLEEMTVEFNKKLDEYSRKVDTMSDLARATKEAELEDMQRRIQTFQETAQQDIQKKRVELFQPVQEAALKAVNEVAEEHGFTYILDMGMGAVVYASPDSEDILLLVKEKLGIE
ncbi:MAG: OmpH family outer membrane protein [Bacteroidales bacterium]|nr:OmpH family outer membrane protein [Bacteroidales bacterium]